MALVIGLVALVALGVFFATPIYALATNPPSDASAIKAEYEGLQGRAGPNAKVISIRRAGIWIAGRNQPTYRRYEVTLERHSGDRATKMVGVAVGLVRGGSVDELPFLTARDGTLRGSRSVGQRVGTVLAYLGAGALAVGITLVLVVFDPVRDNPPMAAFRFDHPVFILAAILAVVGGASLVVGGVLVRRPRKATT